MEAQKLVSLDFSNETSDGGNSGFSLINTMYGKQIADIQKFYSQIIFISDCLIQIVSINSIPLKINPERTKATKFPAGIDNPQIDVTIDLSLSENHWLQNCVITL